MQRARRVADLKGGDAAHNAEALRAVLAGQDGRLSRRRGDDGGAALLVAGKADGLQGRASRMARRQSIDGGAARKVLEKLVKVSNGS